MGGKKWGGVGELGKAYQILNATQIGPTMCVPHFDNDFLNV